MIGKVIGDKYVLLEKIGQGGQGSVYLARDLRLGKHWAVKALDAGKRREAAVLKSLEHSMIPRVVDCVEQEGRVWLAMDYIDGRNLRQMQEEGHLPKRRLLGWAIELCQVLAYLHGLKPPYVYGDLKPENLVVSREGKLFLVDFGAGAVGYGACAGTPGYAAPEQEKGAATCLSDIYAFGKTWERLLGKHAGPGWGKIIQKCCRQSPKKRYQRAGELEKALKAMEKRRESRWLFLLLAGFLAVCGAVGYSVGNAGDGNVGADPSRAGNVGAAADGQAEEGERLGDLAENLGQAASIQEEAGREKALGETVEELEGFYGEASPEGWKLRGGLLLAWGYREEGRVTEAEAVYQELLGLYPDSGECYGSYGCMLLDIGADEKQLQGLYQKGERMVSDKKEYHYRLWKENMEAGL